MKKIQLNLGVILCLAILTAILAYILVEDDILPFAIPTVMEAINHRVGHWHVLVVGLMPVYVALMIFGTGMLSIYLGSAVQRWLGCFSNQK